MAARIVVPPFPLVLVFLVPFGLITLTAYRNGSSGLPESVISTLNFRPPRQQSNCSITVETSSKFPSLLICSISSFSAIICPPAPRSAALYGIRRGEFNSCAHHFFPADLASALPACLRWTAWTPATYSLGKPTSSGKRSFQT